MRYKFLKLPTTIRFSCDGTSECYCIYPFPYCNYAGSFLQKAKNFCDSIDMEIVPGHRVLGSTIGSEAACNEFRENVTTEYQHKVAKPATHARKSPQNVYHAFTQGIQNKLSFLSRTTPDMEPFLQKQKRRSRKNCYLRSLERPRTQQSSV